MNEYERQPPPPPNQPYPGYQGHQLPPFPSSQPPYYAGQSLPQPPRPRLSGKARAVAWLGSFSPGPAIFFAGILGLVFSIAIFITIYLLRRKCDIRERSDRNVRTGFIMSLGMVIVSAIGAVVVARIMSDIGDTSPLEYISPMLYGLVTT